METYRKVPKCLLQLPKPIAKTLNSGTFGLVATRAAARAMCLQTTNLDICQLYCRLKILEDNTRMLVFTMSSETKKAIKSGTMSVNKRGGSVSYWPLRERIKKFHARGFILLDEFNLDFFNLDSDSSDSGMSD